MGIGREAGRGTNAGGARQGTHVRGRDRVGRITVGLAKPLPPKTGSAGPGLGGRDMQARSLTGATTGTTLSAGSGGALPSPTSFLDVVALPDLGNTCFISCVLQLLVRMPKLLRRCQGLSSAREADALGGRILDMYHAMAISHDASAAWEAFQRIVTTSRARGWQPTTGTRLSISNPRQHSPGDPQHFLLHLLEDLDAGATSGGISDLFSISVSTRYACQKCTLVSFAQGSQQIATPFLPLHSQARDRHLQTILDQFSDPQANTERVWCSECRGRQDHLSRRVVTTPPHYLCVRLRRDIPPLRRPAAHVWFPRAVDQCRCDFSQTNQACVCGARRRYEVVGSLGIEQEGEQHFVASVPDIDGMWHLVDHRVRRVLEPLTNPHILFLRHHPDEDVSRRVHEERLGAELPCADCMVPGCYNSVRTEAVEVRRSEWLPEQRGLYTTMEVRSGTFLAIFAVRNVQGAGGRADYYIRAVAAGGGTVQYLRPADSASAGVAKVAAFANHSCCFECVNCSIVHSGCAEQPVAWIRALRDIPANAEVLVDYGSSYGMTQCRCAQCSPPHGGAPHQHFE